MASSQQTTGAAGPLKEMRFSILPDRMPRIPEERMTDAQKQAAAELAAGPRGSLRGPFVALMRSPELMRRVQKVGEYLRFQGVLDMRINELAALMGARSWTQQYEWNAHVPHALKAGVKPAVIEAIAEGRRPIGMAEDEEIVYDFVTELLANKGVSDATYARAVGKFGEQGVVDVTAVVGYYTLLAMIMNVARTAIPDGKPLPLVPLPSQVRPNG
jgi:4-carboxymuconolactone decarboxylase